MLHNESDGRNRFWRMAGKHSLPKCIVPTRKFRGFKRQHIQFLIFFFFNSTFWTACFWTVQWVEFGSECFKAGGAVSSAQRCRVSRSNYSLSILNKKCQPAKLSSQTFTCLPNVHSNVNCFKFNKALINHDPKHTQTLFSFCYSRSLIWILLLKFHIQLFEIWIWNLNPSWILVGSQTPLWYPICRFCMI